MKNKLTYIVIYSLLVGMLFPVTNTAAAAFKQPENKIKIIKEPEPAKFAVLIGINNYNDPKINDLEGCENDVRMMREVLSEIYGFNPATDIKELLSSSKKADEKPTLEVIVNSFKQFLIENAKRYKEENKLTPDKGATIVFYYSGHGSHLADQPGANEEADGQDETIVPMDSNKNGKIGDRDTDIRDDDLNALFKELSRYTTNITFIFDSCHSGTVTRGFGSRSIERLSPDSKSRGDGVDVALNDEMSDNENYVTISGSLPNEKSQEDLLPSQDEMRRGVTNPRNHMNGYLTYYLVQELRNIRGATYREIMDNVKRAVLSKSSNQTPQIEGDVDRAFLGSKESRNKRAIKINAAEKDGKGTILTIDAGRIVGALPGGTVGIYSETAQQLSGDKDRIAVGKIVEAGNFNSQVRVSEADISTKAKVILANPFFTDEKRTAAIDAAEKNSASKIIERLEKNDYVQAKLMQKPIDPANRKGWDIAVVRGTYKEFKFGTRTVAKKDASAPKDDDVGYFLANKNGDSIYDFWISGDDADKAANEIKDALEKHTRVENLLALGNAASQFSNGVKIKLIKLKSWKARTSESGPCTAEEYTKEEREKNASAMGQLNPGDYFYFEITNETGEQLFPYLYDISPDGQIQLLYQPVADGDVLRNGTSKKTLSQMKCSGLFRATLPFGKETFKLIATSTRFDGKMLESPKIARSVMENSKDARGADSALTSLFAQAATNQRSEKVEIPFSGWATSSLEVEVK